MADQYTGKRDFFISYNKADSAWAEWIAWYLEEDGYSVFIQAWDFRPASNFVLDMQKAASQADRTIAVLSPDYLDAEYTQPEWAAAFAQDPTGKDRKLVPIRVRACKPEGLMTPIVCIDLVGLEEKDARDRLVQGIYKCRVKPATAPAFPGKKPPVFPGEPPILPATSEDISETDKDDGNNTSKDTALQPATSIPMNIEQKFQLIEALLACATMRDRHTRDTVVNNLPDDIKNSIDRSTNDQVDIDNIVTRCLDYPDGIRELIKIVRFYEKGSIPMQQLDELMNN